MTLEGLCGEETSKLFKDNIRIIDHRQVNPCRRTRRSQLTLWWWSGSVQATALGAGERSDGHFARGERSGSVKVTAMVTVALLVSASIIGVANVVNDD